MGDKGELERLLKTGAMDAQRRAHRTLSKVYKDGVGAAAPIMAP